MGSRRAKSTYFLVIGLAVVVAGVLATGNAQAQALRVHGTVVDTQGNPLPGAVVKLTPAETAQGPLQGKSNKKGVFTVAFAKPGDYYLSATLGDLKLVQIAVKMRDQDRRPPTLPDGTRIEDAAGPVDPNKPEVPIGIPGNVFEVDLTLTLGTPAAQRAAPAAPAGPAVAPQMAELQKAKDAIMAGDFQTTVDEVNMILQNKDQITDIEDLSAIYYMKSYALMKLERAAEAEQAAREALNVNPQLAPAWDVLAGSQIQQKKFAEAVESMRKQLELATDPARKAQIQTNLGKALLEIDKPDEAVAVLEEAHAAVPDDVDTTVQLIDAYTRLNKVEQAEALIPPDLSPADAATLQFNIAVNYVRIKRWAEAEEHFKRVMELNPQLPVTHKYLGEVYLNMDKHAEALKELEAYVAAAPDAPDAAETKEVIEALRKMAKHKK